MTVILVCSDCNKAIKGEIQNGYRCTSCYIDFLEKDINWADAHILELKAQNEKFSKRVDENEHTIRRLNLEAQRWFDIAMDSLHK